MFIAGVSETVIAQHGRWRSDCYRRYFDAGTPHFMATSILVEHSSGRYFSATISLLLGSFTNASGTCVHGTKSRIKVRRKVRIKVRINLLAAYLFISVYFCLFLFISVYSVYFYSLPSCLSPPSSLDVPPALVFFLSLGASPPFHVVSVPSSCSSLRSTFRLLHRHQRSSLLSFLWRSSLCTYVQLLPPNARPDSINEGNYNIL